MNYRQRVRRLAVAIALFLSMIREVVATVVDDVHGADLAVTLVLLAAGSVALGWMLADFLPQSGVGDG